MNEDHERIDWLEEVAQEVVITIAVGPNQGPVTVTVGRVSVPGYTLREAIDAAMGVPR